MHAIAIDARGRVFVGDRANNRIQLFDQEGTHLASWTQFGRPSGIFFDTTTASSSRTPSPTTSRTRAGTWVFASATRRPAPWHRVHPLPGGDPRGGGNGAEFAVVDRDGNIYGGEPRPRRLQKYVRVRP